jgi:hypothetical protein
MQDQPQLYAERPMKLERGYRQNASVKSPEVFQSLLTEQI